MIEMIGTVSMVLAVTGVVLNNRRRRACFIFWVVSNCMSMVIHAYTGVYSLAVRDVIFIVLAIEGWFLWKDSCKGAKVQSKKKNAELAFPDKVICPICFSTNNKVIKYTEYGTQIRKCNTNECNGYTFEIEPIKP